MVDIDGNRTRAFTPPTSRPLLLVEEVDVFALRQFSCLLAFLGAIGIDDDKTVAETHCVWSSNAYGVLSSSSCLS